MLRLAVLVTLIVMFWSTMSYTRENELWAQNDAQTRAFYQNIAYCCGEADAYWADDFESTGDQYIAIITDDREIPGRQPRPIGSKFTVPNNKIVTERNPTGHGIIFLQPGTENIYCYLPPAGL